MPANGVRELQASELFEVAGGYTSGAAAAAAQEYATTRGGTYGGYNGSIDPDNPGPWQYISDGGDGGLGGYTIWMYDTTVVFGPDTGNGEPPDS